MGTGNQVVSGGETQEQIDQNINKMIDKFPELFEGIGKAKVSPVHRMAAQHSDYSKEMGPLENKD